MMPIRLLIVYATGDSNATLSYQHTWPRQLRSHPGFVCTPINLLDRRWHSRWGRHLSVRGWRGDAVVLLHSVFSNGCLLAGRLFDAIRRLPQPKVFFIGNEYKLMPEKMRFCDELGLALFVTQTTEPAVHSQYRERLGCAVLGLPNTGFDPASFTAATLLDERPIDLGYRSMDSLWYLGHRERRDIATYFQTHAARLRLTVDISLDPADRFAEQEWAGFLNRCRGQLGTEAGGDYFDLTDGTRIAVNAFVNQHPQASFEEVHSRFFAGRPPDVPMRILSSRNVEAAGTRTVQILFEGRYDGYLQPDVHYIPLKKDFSNVDDAVRKFRDPEFAKTIADNAQRLVTEEFTYERLIGRFADALEPLL